MPPSRFTPLSRSSWNPVLLGVCGDVTAQAPGPGGDPMRPVCSDSSWPLLGLSCSLPASRVWGQEPSGMRRVPVTSSLTRWVREFFCVQF